MATPKHHIELVEKLVSLVLALPSVEYACVNDWGRHSNFDIRVCKKPVVVNGKLTNGSYRPAITFMKRFCKENKMIYREHFIPHSSESDQCMSVDIDFVPYEPSTNTFSGVQPEGDLAEMNALQLSLFGR